MVSLHHTTNSELGSDMCASHYHQNQGTCNCLFGNMSTDHNRDIQLHVLVRTTPLLEISFHWLESRECVSLDLAFGYSTLRTCIDNCSTCTSNISLREHGAKIRQVTVQFMEHDSCDSHLCGAAIVKLDRPLLALPLVGLLVPAEVETTVKR